MNTMKDILKKMKLKASQENSFQNSNTIPTMKLQANQRIKVKILRDSKTDKSQDPFKINIIHTQILPKRIQCNFLFESQCPLCDLENDKEWNNLKWNEYNNGNKDVWKLMMKTQAKWISSLLVVPVEEIYKTNPNKELHILYLWGQEVQDLVEQYVVLQDNVKEKINNVYFYLTRIKTKGGYRLKIEPVSDETNKLTDDRKIQIKKELKEIPSLNERITIPAEPLNAPDIYFTIIKPFIKVIQSQQEFLPEETYTQLIKSDDRVFNQYIIDENEAKEKLMDEMLTPAENIKAPVTDKTTAKSVDTFLEDNKTTKENKKETSLFDDEDDF